MTTLNSPSRDNMEIDTELVSPIRHIRFSDRYKVLFQETPPRGDSIDTESLQKSPLAFCSSPKKVQEARRATIRNEDRGQWREMASPKRNEVKEDEEEQKKEEQKKEEEKKEKKEEMVQDTAPETTTPVENKKASTPIKPPKASKIPSPSASVPAKKSLPRYMMATTSFRSKAESKKQKESLGVRSVGKISKRQTTSKIPRYNYQSNEDAEFKRLSFQGTYVPMASRVKSFEKELRPLSVKSEEGNHNKSISSSPSTSIRTNAPKFKLFKFATSERAKKHHQQRKN